MKKKALAFALVSEDWLNNPKTYSDAITLKVKLHTLILSDISQIFSLEGNITLDQYLVGLLMEQGGKNQILNINLEDIDDRFAKALVKVYCRIIFKFSKSLKERGAMPIHLMLEEAHRYVQRDNDINILGYNFMFLYYHNYKYFSTVFLIFIQPFI